MQGTIVMLMALSGLGCHHKGCNDCYSAPAVVSSCYSACYDVGYVASAPGCYSSAQSCYGGYEGCYSLSSCYSSACYSMPAPACGSCGSNACGGGCGASYASHGCGRKHRGLFGCLKRKMCGGCAPVASCYGGYGCYGGNWASCYGGWSTAGYTMGSYTPVYGGQIISGPVYSSGQVIGSPVYSSGQVVGSSQAVYSAPVTTPAPAAAGDAAPAAPAESAPAAEAAPAAEPTPPPPADNLPAAEEAPATPPAPAPGL